MVRKDPESDGRAWRALGLAVIAPAALYLLIFHHLRCETGAEQFVAAVLGLAGLMAAVNLT